MKRIVEIVLHLLFWLVVLVVQPYYQYVWIRHNGYRLDSDFLSFLLPPGYAIEKLVSLSIYLAGFYLLYLATSYVLHKKREIRFALYFGWLILISIPLLLIAKGQLTYVLDPCYFIILSTTGLFAGVVKGIVLWLVGLSQKRILQKRQLEIENALMLLKAQLNPHFLFNSLNNIDILIEESPEVASGYLRKLSGILRYVLYETKEDVTTLSQELTQIGDYIELQKIRSSNNSYVEFKVEGPVGTQKLVPMLFLPFIENAFKFSKDKTLDKAIEIRFDISDDSVRMLCRNTYDPSRLQVIRNEGLGIRTIRQRLELLYPGKYKLEIDDAGNIFDVRLQIPLT